MANVAGFPLTRIMAIMRHSPLQFFLATVNFGFWCHCVHRGVGLLEPNQATPVVQVGDRREDTEDWA